MSEQFLLLLGANQFQRERALIGAEKAFNGQIVTISPLSPFHINKYPSITLRSNETEPKQLLADIVKFVERTKLLPAAVIPLNDFVLNAGLEVAEHFKLPYNSRTTIMTCRTKDLMKQTLAAAGIPVVPSYRFKTLNEATALAEKVGYPLVIKPLNFGGSGGVVKVETANQLQEAITHTHAHLQKHASHYDSDSNQLLLEPYISIKQEISVEVINSPSFRKVIGITDKFLSQEPYFSEVGHQVPSAFTQDEKLANKINAVALKACEALNIQYGMSHVEIKVNAQGEIVVIEVGARTAGDGIMDLYEKALGKNIYELHCKAFLNQLTENDLPKRFLNTAAIGYLHPQPGIIEKINTEALSSTDLLGVDLIAIRSQVNQKVESAKDWSTRYGFVEYTLLNHSAAKEFDLIDTTNKITQKVFSIAKE